ALKVQSTVARSSVESTTFANKDIGPIDGVGRNSLIAQSSVTVQGGWSAPALFIKCQAAVQLQWQSSSVTMIPPFNTPGNASYLDRGIHSATTSSPCGKLRIRKPLALAGPQPQHELFGAYFSWSDLFIVAALYERRK